MTKKKNRIVKTLNSLIEHAKTLPNMLCGFVQYVIMKS